MRHLKKNGMTYLQHWVFAVGHSVRCLAAACKLFVHAWLPCVFENAGRNLVKRMVQDFKL